MASAQLSRWIRQEVLEGQSGNSGASLRCLAGLCLVTACPCGQRGSCQGLPRMRGGGLGLQKQGLECQWVTEDRTGVQGCHKQNGDIRTRCSCRLQRLSLATYCWPPSQWTWQLYFSGMAAVTPPIPNPVFTLSLSHASCTQVGSVLPLHFGRLVIVAE